MQKPNEDGITPLVARYAKEGKKQQGDSNTKTLILFTLLNVLTMQVVKNQLVDYLKTLKVHIE